MCPVHEWSDFWMVWVHRYKNNGQPFENRTKMSGFRMVGHHFDICGFIIPFEYQTLKSPVFRWIRFSGVRYWDGYCTVRIQITDKSCTVEIWISTIWIPPETFEYQTFWCLDFKWSVNVLCLMCQNDHLNTRPEHKKIRWCPFVWYSNGWAVVDSRQRSLKASLMLLILDLINLACLAGRAVRNELEAINSLKLNL